MAPIESDRLPRKRPGVNNLCSQQPHKIALDDLCAQLNLRDIRAGLTTTQVNEAQWVERTRSRPTSWFYPIVLSANVHRLQCLAVDRRHFCLSRLQTLR